MEIESELLSDGLIEIISWVKSSSAGEPQPPLVAEIISAGRATLTFFHLVFTVLCVCGVWGGYRSFWAGSTEQWKEWKLWLPHLSISIFLLTVGLIGLIVKTEVLMQVWFAPRMYVIEKLAELVVS